MFFFYILKPKYQQTQSKYFSIEKIEKIMLELAEKDNEYELYY